MSSTEMSSRKRKACLQCIRAKAKCSPSDEKPDECHRCLRLNKQCVFEVVAKKPGPGPKSRSRVRQLEQRVESLIDLIAAQKAAGSTTDPRILEQVQNSMQAITPDSTTVQDSPADSSASGPAAKYHIASAPFQPYDPVDAGIIEEQYAYRLVEDFKKTFVHSFPFVVLDTDAATLRQNQPFLFHAILTATAYESPSTQLLLGGEFKVQIARIIEHSRKSLEILQGLLVYAAWYHAFYQPVSQQIAIIVQLCVALVQDLGISKHSKQAPQKWSVADCAVIGRPKGTLAEKRAYAGTFYLSVSFAQAWRKTTTLRHSRYMAQCAEIFASSTVPTDALIKPMLQASELLMRVNDSFSYDDIENSEIRGEMLLDMCATNFLAELKRIRDAANMIPSVQQNPTITLMFYLVELTINEICVHSALWGSEGQMTAASPPLIRVKMLNRVMETATAYVDVLIGMPQTSLFRLGLGTWAAWFYVVIIMCRIVFLRENERLGQSDLDNIPEELDNLIPENIEQVIARSAATNYQDRPAETIWDAVTIAREYKVQAQFEGFMEKLRFTLPVGVVPWSLPHDQRDALHSIGSIQQTMLYGFKKRLNRLASGSTTTRNETQIPAPVDANASVPLEQTGDSSAWRSAYLASTSTYATGNVALPFSGLMNFDSINFDGVNIPGSMYTPQVGQEVLGDFMWDMVMDDFRMPGL